MAEATIEGTEKEEGTGIVAIPNPGEIPNPPEEGSDPPSEASSVINLLSVSQGSNQTSSIPPVTPMEGNITASLLYRSGGSIFNLGSSSTEVTFEGDRNKTSDYTPLGLDIIEVEEHPNQLDGMYYVEYRTKITDGDFIDSPPRTVNIQEDENSFLEITQSLVPAEDQNTYKFTGSIEFYRQRENDPNPLGQRIFKLPFTVPTSESIDQERRSAKYMGDYRPGDRFRFAVTQDSKTTLSGLTITGYTASINPIYTRFSINPNVPDDLMNNYSGYNEALPINTTIPNYYGGGTLPFVFATDCQPLLNNAVSNRLSSFLQDVDYTNVSGSQIPVNQQQLLDFTAIKAAVPDSNYSALKVINPRYKGSKSTSKYINEWVIGDEGTYGKLPTIELRNSYFGYFDSIEDPYPNKNDVVKLNLTYLIDQQGNALPPALEGISKNIFEKVFPLRSLGTLSISSGDKVLKKLNSSYPLNNVGSYPTPIIFSQNSSNSYVTSIPLTGSGRISRYDNNDSNGVSYYTFNVMGTSSIDTSTPLQNVSYTIDPSEQFNQIGTDLAYNVGNGTIKYDNDSIGNDLTNSQKLTLQTSIPTSYIYDTNRTQDEMTLILSLVSGSANIPFNFKDIQLKVHKTSGEYDLGSVIGQGWFNFVSSTSKNVRASTDTPRLNSNNQIQITIDWEMYQFLRRKGMYQKGGDAGFRNPELLSLEWILTADSGDYIFKGGDEVYWKLEGNMKNTSAGDEPQTSFFPPFHPKSTYTPSKISSIGALDHVFATDNTALAPYWVFGSELSPSVSTPNNVLYMSSSNMNEAYGVEYYQGEIPYIPGPSPYFPNNVEPAGTQFDTIEYPLEIKPGDEIRFANNENYLYTILNVTPPQDNIIGGVGRIKIVLNKNVPGDVNKDFFLIRRNIPDANSVYMGTTFPYRVPVTASSSPGILYPEFPTELLSTSASLIVEDLVDKGIIK